MNIFRGFNMLMFAKRINSGNRNVFLPFKGKSGENINSHETPMLSWSRITLDVKVVNRWLKLKSMIFLV